MKRFTILSLFIFLFLSEFLIAQVDLSTKDKKAVAYFEEAMKQYRYNEWEAVETNLKMALNRDSNFIEAHLELALFYGEKNISQRLLNHSKK